VISQSWVFSCSSILVLSVRLCIGGSYQEYDKKLLNEIVRSTRAKTAHEQALGHSAFFDARMDFLATLKTHSHDGIAVRAAWEEIASRLPGAGPKEPIPVKAGKLKRFLGFVEGRLRVNVPDEWEAAFSNLHCYRRTALMFDRPKEARYQNGELGFRLPAPLKIDQNGAKPVLRSGADSVMLPVQASKKNADHIDACFTGDHCYLAVHGDHTVEYQLYCIERKSGNVAWQAQVWANGAFWGPEKIAHRVAVVASDERVLVFGMADESAYIEDFAAKDGANLFRFSTFR